MSLATFWHQDRPELEGSEDQPPNLQNRCPNGVVKVDSVPLLPQTPEDHRWVHVMSRIPPIGYPKSGNRFIPNSYFNLKMVSYKRPNVLRYDAFKKLMGVNSLFRAKDTIQRFKDLPFPQVVSGHQPVI